ncbi:MAG: ribose-5-phosphate isomerase RpiA [Pseudomonadota bacterium]
MDARELKIQAAAAALEHVQPGMRLGIGTGSTADEFVRLLAERVDAGFDVQGVPTSERTAGLCLELGVPLFSIEDVPQLDLTIDGADELDHDLRLIKGGGGALLREKIVAAASAKMIVIADETKVVETLGHYPLPIEVNPFGLKATQINLEKTCTDLGLNGSIDIRTDRSVPFETDGGHYILDASFGRIRDAEALASALNAVPGVVEHGLFLGYASQAIIAGSSGIRIIKSRGNQES